jgi:DNA-binding IclR family transcriptional regulator
MTPGGEAKSAALCYPSLRELAASAGFGKSVAHQAMTALSSLGLVERRTAAQGAVMGVSGVYRLTAAGRAEAERWEQLDRTSPG